MIGSIVVGRSTVAFCAFGDRIHFFALKHFANSGASDSVCDVRVGCGGYWAVVIQLGGGDHAGDGASMTFERLCI